MKFFTVFAAILAVALASPADWTVNELSVAIQDPNTPVALKPILIEALNELMFQVMTGNAQSTTTVSTAVQDFSSWTLYELSEAIQNPATDPILVIYLEEALNSMMHDLVSGGQPEYVIVATPVGLLPVDAVIVPAPVETIVVPTPVEESIVSPASSPLVQIIVNVKSQQQQLPIAPAPVILPEPVFPEVEVNPIDIIAINPDPVIIPEPVVLPEPVLPEVEVNPIDIIAINPDPVVNPIDVIAIAAPEVNPIDILAPVPVVNPAGAVDVVGPMV